MPARTVDELQDRLDEALAWRRIELSALKGLIESNESMPNNPPVSRSLRRAGVAMLYAHWEGFGKECLQSYVDFISRRRLKLQEFNDELLRVCLMHTVRRADSGDLSAKGELVELVRRRGELRLPFPKSQMVDTQGNLRSHVLTNMLKDFGLQSIDFELRENLIDRRLCDTRNSVAHGRETCPEVGEFSELHAEVLEMMEYLRDLVLGAARAGTYRSAAAASADELTSVHDQNSS
ncbi:MAE_28990/MAE_18760 family HEPN-like nuclease [Mycobacterium sp. 852002-50816_SCH5313054-b]|uniref:MAE_28990/MAE_18760 family HEPN-like nuclease n=1 Tax=Mycobacterium sp. 852002-50816_SCH5313054-b TaxID=1834092 RepID=UPI000A52BA2C|nr:MAE_28990/MAE_18760 family HEPN-like nuclease [Mycobacterium sp. 852002-50816_SCH5313054-b]